MIFTVICLYASVNMSYSACINRLHFFSFYFLLKLVHTQLLQAGLYYDLDYYLSRAEDWIEMKLSSYHGHYIVHVILLQPPPQSTITIQFFVINYRFQVMHDMSCQKPHDNNGWLHWQLNSGSFSTSFLFPFPCHKYISSTITAIQYSDNDDVHLI